MTRTPQRWSLARSLLVLSLAGLAACAGKGDVNRTQPDRLDKTIFYNADGSPRLFYYRKTVVGVPPTTAFAFEGAMGELMKVRFDITENYLVGYRSYDYVLGAQNVNTGGANNRDTPLLIFKIGSHFDVKREYNPGTGEETNVISENTTDRSWNQRQYMRVEWGSNLAEMDGDPTDPMDFLATKKLEVGFDVGEGERALVNPDRPTLTRDYIDFATKEMRTPDYMACLKLFDSWDDEIGPWGCGQSEITYRNALMPVPTSSSFEPLAYPDREILRDDKGNPIRTVAGNNPCTANILKYFGGAASGADCDVASVDQFSKFGFFRIERSEYDRRVGATEEGRQYYATRWNIWQDSMKKDTDGKPVLINGKPVVLDYSARTTRTIPYYLNVEFPNDPSLREMAQMVVDDWDQAMRETVAALVLNEANGNGAVGMTEIKKKAATLPKIVVLKENGCSLDNVNAFVAANKDVRKLVEDQVSTETLDLESVTSANLTQACSVLAKVTEDRADDDADHPKFVWQRDGDLRYSFLYWVDRPQPGGPLGYGPSSADPETGEIISAAAYIYGAALDTYAQFAVDSVRLANSSLDPDDFLAGKTISDVLLETAKASKARLDEPLTSGARNLGLSRLRAQGKSSRDRVVKVGAGIDDQAIARVRGTPIEKLLLNDDVLPGMIRGYKPGDVAPADAFEQVMGNPWVSSQAREQQRARFQNLAGHHGCIYMADFADDAILGTAMDLDHMGLSGDAMFKELRARIFRGLADHEMGHTMGLRHNFAASTDALNYADDFWRIHETPPADPTKPPSEEWAKQGLAEYQYASVMDYGARFNSDIHGLGKYDTAAIRFGYGQLIDLMPKGAASYDTKLVNDIFFYDYTKLPQAVGGVDNIVSADTPVIPYFRYRDVLVDDYVKGKNLILPERPYKFCEDFFEGNLDCKTWDHGANQREIVDNVQQMYRNYYIFNAYKRGRTTWQVDDYLTRIATRYFNRYSEAFEFYFFLGDAFTDPDYADKPVTEEGGRGLGMPTIGDDLLMASMSGLNALGAVLQTPEPGPHCAVSTQPNVMIREFDEAACMKGQTLESIALPDAKPFFISLSDDFYYRITQSGSLYDKLEALFTLTSTESRFFRVTDADINGRSSINFFREFHDEMLKLLSGVIRDDSASYGGTMVNGVYQPTLVVDPRTFGTLGATPTPRGPVVVDTPVNKTIRYWALLLGLARLGSTWDATLDFQNHLVVSVKGSNDDQAWGSNITVREYTHPQTGVIYRAPVYPGVGNIGSGILDELAELTGSAGVRGTLSDKWGTYKDNPVPTWYTAKADLDAAAAGTDQKAYEDAQEIFTILDQMVAYRIDLISDIRSFRKQLLLP
jgi:hypothetical protein